MTILKYSNAIDTGLILTQPNNYYVSPTGDDTTGDGSAYNPFATVAYAISQVSNLSLNSTIVLYPGNYFETTISIKPNISFMGMGEKFATISVTNPINRSSDWASQSGFVNMQNVSWTGAGTFSLDFSAVSGHTSTFNFLNCSFGAFTFIGKGPTNPDILQATNTNFTGALVINSSVGANLNACVFGSTVLTDSTHGGATVLVDYGYLSNNLTVHSTSGTNVTTVNGSVNLGTTTVDQSGSTLVLDSFSSPRGSAVVVTNSGHYSPVAFSASKYQINGSDVLSEDLVNSNLFVGDAIPSGFGGTGNIVVGRGSMNTASVTTFNNTVVGDQALVNPSTSGYNTVFGGQAMQSNSTGQQNTAIGFQSLNASISADNCTALGNYSLASVTSATPAIGIGYGALSDLTTGNFNIGIGYNVGSTLVTGTNNVIIGDNADTAGAADTGVVGIGYASATTTSGVAIGSSSAVTGAAGTAVGTSAQSIADSVALGAGAHANQTSSIAIGRSVSAVGAHDVYIGATSSSGDFKLNGRAINLASFVDGNVGTIQCDGSGNFFKSASPAGNYNNVTTTSATMAPDNVYASNNAGLVTLTLPATAPQGSVIEVLGVGAGGWSIAQNAGQSIVAGIATTTVGAGGSVSSTQARDTLRFICIVANTTFQVLSGFGSPNYV